MATRRLMQGRRGPEESPQSPRARQQSSNTNRPRPSQAIALPPYEAPSCPLSAQARHQLSQLAVNYDYSKYKKSLESCRLSLTANIADSFDRVNDKNAVADRQTERRRKAGGNDDEQTEEEIEAIKAAKELEMRVLELQAKAEKAFRELVDFEDELQMHDVMMREVITKIPDPPAQRQRQNGRANTDSDDEEDAVEADEVDHSVQVPDVPGVSTIDLWKERRQEYLDGYNSKSMLHRYEKTDYASFIRTVHSSRHGDDIPVPHARTWFGEDGKPQNPESTGPRRTAAQEEDDDSDDDVVVSRATATLKCPLTLQYFIEPFTSKVCNHTFEKAAFLGYFTESAKYHDQALGPRGRPVGDRGEKKAPCPTSGCQKLLKLEDFYIDKLIMRQVKRAQAGEARDDDDDDDEEDGDDVPRGTQQRPAVVASSDNEIDIEEDEQHRKRKMSKVKLELAQHSKASVRPSQATQGAMDLDDDDDDD